MNKNKMFLITITIMLLMLMSSFQPSMTATASNKAVLQPTNDTKTFNPTTIGNDGLYIIKGNTSYNNIVYKNPNQASTSFTLYQPSNNGYSINTPSTVNDQSQLSSNIPGYLGNNLFASPNLFSNVTYDVPALVALESNTSSLALQDTAPFSLHLDQSQTIFLQANRNYYGMIDHFGNLLLDLDVKDSGASVNVNFANSYPSSVTVKERNTIPVINGGTNRYLMTITTNQDTFLTITAHDLPNSKLVSDTLPVNSSDLFTVNQGQCFSTSSGSINPSHNDVMSINKLSMSLVKDSYYEIFVDNQSLDSSSSACSNLQSRTQSFYTNKTGVDYLQVYNPNNVNVFTFKALKTGELTLFLNYLGYYHQDTTVFFRQITNPSRAVFTALPLNTATSLFPNTYYTFNTTSPTLFAINYTDSALSTSLPGYILSLNQQTQQYDSGTFMSYYSVYGNLYQSSVSSSIPDIWAYLPAGHYAINSPFTQITSLNYHVTVNVLTLNQLQANQNMNIPVNNNTLVAFELHPQLYRYNFLNISTSMHDNVAVNYNYRIFSSYSKSYNDLSGTTQYFGNKLVGANYQAYNDNNSAIYDFYKLNEKVSPILILAPNTAQNVTTTHLISKYNTNVNVSLNAYGENYIKASGYSYSNIILYPSVISATASAPINNDMSTSTSQTFIFNLENQPDSLYNVTVYALGNSTGAPNINSVSFTAEGGIYSTLNSGYLGYSGANSTAVYESQNILTQGTNTVLMINVARGFVGGQAQNGTLFIQVKNLNVQELTFNQTDLRYVAWNQTKNKYESSDSSTLFTIVRDAPKSSPIDPMTVLLALVTLPFIRKYYKKRHLK